MGVFKNVIKKLFSSDSVAPQSKGITIRTNEDVPCEMQDVIAGYQFVAALDERTCLECLQLDGQVTDQKPPLHEGCRCARVPKTKSWAELGINLEEIEPNERASAIGPISGNAYREYLIERAQNIKNGMKGEDLAVVLRDFVDKLEKKYPNDKDEIVKIKNAVFSVSPTNDIDKIEDLLNQVNWPADPWDLIVKCADLERDDLIEESLFRMARQVPKGEYCKRHQEHLFRKAADTIKKHHPHLSIKYYTIATKHNPKNTAGMIALAKAYKRVEDKKNAKIWFGKVLKVNPDHKGAKKEYNKL